MDNTGRRYDLDWLRVIVFALLIFYHVGMFFVPWGWHIKNNVIYDDLRWPMLFLNQWRLPILFVISGMGTYYALSKRNLRQFNWERFKRLGIPLFVGMVLIVPPQLYIERLANGEFTGSYLEYYQTMAFRNGAYPQGDISWHHLWFLPYLLLFSWILGPIFNSLKHRPGRFIKWIKRLLERPFGLYLFVIPLYPIEALVEPFFPTTHALIGDWFTISFFMVLFFFGFVLIAAGNSFWDNLSKIKYKALLIGLICFGAQLVIWLFFEDNTLIHFTEAFLKVLNIWSWILVLFAFAAHYLNRSSRFIAYANRAVYPFYILHQTITVVLAYFLMEVSLSFPIKALVLVVGTFGCSWLLYHCIILKMPWLHPLFGLKSVNSSK